LGGLHTDRTLLKILGPDLDPLPWAHTGSDTVAAQLLDSVRKASPDLAPEKAREAARQAQAALADALYRRVDGLARRQAAGMLRRTARGLDRIARSPERQLQLLRLLSGHTDHRARIANLEALGLDSDDARGLDLKLSMPGGLERLAERGQTALHSRAEPFFLSDFSASLLGSAARLRTLALRMDGDRSLHVFDQFPELARGLLRGRSGRSFLVETVRQRFERHALHAKLDRIAGVVGAILQTIGAGLLGPLESGVNLAVGGASIGSAMADIEESWQGALASAASGGMSDADFKVANHNHNRAQVLLGATAVTYGIKHADAAVDGAGAFLEEGDEPFSVPGNSLCGWILSAASYSM
jgi:hypothetical protein